MIINPKSDSLEFTCKACQQTFTKARSDEEAWDEAERVFTKEELAEGCVVVCDDCWVKAGFSLDS